MKIVGKPQKIVWGLRNSNILKVSFLPGEELLS